MLKTRFQRYFSNVIETRICESAAASRCLLLSVSERVEQGRWCKKNEIILLTAASCGKIENYGLLADIIGFLSVDNQA